MAKVHPPLELFRPSCIGEWGEYQILSQLEKGLPDGFDVFHSVNWSSVHEGEQRFGELDAVVLSPLGHIVLLEIKTGEVTEAAGRLTKRYGGQVKDVDRQTRQQHAAMRASLKHAGLSSVRVSQFLVFLDARIHEGTVSHPRERIIDASEVADLCTRIRSVVASSESTHEVVDRDHLRQFLEDRFELALDPTARVGRLTAAVHVMANGLATWVPRIHSPSGTYQIQATAGAGKTQLALRLLKDAAQAGQRARYVCFNRSLADHIARIAPPRCEVVTFHELARTTWERIHGTPDFQQSGIFDLMASYFCDCSEADPPRLDLLIIDESQDFEPAWVYALADSLKSEGRLYVMGDAGQAIYERECFDLQGATTITVDENFRSPKAIVQTINLLGLADAPVTARCPLEGELPEFCSYLPEKDPGGVQAVSQVVTRLLKDGYAPEQIALVTMAGHGRSCLLREDSIAEIPLQKFSGQFDSAGNPRWTNGTLTADSVMRFKGQAAPVVVLCEMDFAELDDAHRRRLFVGFTRAQARLVCVLTPQAEAALHAGLVDD